MRLARYELDKEPEYGICCQHVCCHSSPHISLIIGIVLHGQAGLSVGPNPNLLILSSCPDLPSIRQQLRSICGKYRIAVSPAPGSQYHKEASHPIREADVYVCCQVFRAAFYLFSASFSYCWVSKYLSVMFKHLLTGHRSYLLKYLNICHVKPLSYGNNPGRIRGRLIRCV